MPQRGSEIITSAVAQDSLRRENLSPGSGGEIEESTKLTLVFNSSEMLLPNQQRRERDEWLMLTKGKGQERSSHTRPDMQTALGLLP